MRRFLTLLFLLKLFSPISSLACDSAICTPIYLDNFRTIKVVCDQVSLYFKNIPDTIIHAYTFKKCSSAEILNLAGGNIQTIEFKAFDGLSGLTQLNLAYNKIRTVSSGVFRPLEHLEVLIMTGNVLISSPPVETNSLKNLNLDYNKITLINGLQNLVEASHIDLSKNEIASIPPDALFKIQPGAVLILSDNLLESVPLLFQDNQSDKLSELYMSGNLLDQISAETFGEFYKLNLKTLDASFNNISRIHPDAFAKYKLMRKIYLGHNRLTILREDTFENMEGLELLDLSHNYFTNMVFYLHLAKTITHVDLQNNLIDSMVLMSWRSDEPDVNSYFNLNHNRLSYVDVSVLAKFVRRVSFTGNFWICRNLYSTIIDLERRDIKVDHGHSFHTNNVNGIACTIDGVQERPSKFFRKRNMGGATVNITTKPI